MEKGIFTNERNGDFKQLPGRTVIWMATPETTGGKHFSVCSCIYEPGGRAKPAHSHVNGEENVYVISGKGKAKVGDEIYDLEPGSLILFPQGVPHMVWNNSTLPLHIVCFYAPSADAITYTYHEDFDFPEFLDNK